MNKLKELKFEAVMFMALLAIIGMAYFYYESTLSKNTPDYAAAEAFQSIETRNIRLFRKRVDVNSIANSVVNNAFNDSELFPQDVTDKLQGSLGGKLLSLIKPSLVNLFADQMEDYIETGKLADDDHEDMPQILEELWVDLVGLDPSTTFTLEKVSTRKDKATAFVNMYRADLEQVATIEAMLSKIDGTWKVISIQNLNPILQNFKELLTLQKEKRNVEIRIEMLEALKPVTIQLTKSEQPWPQNTQAYLELGFENTTDKDIIGFSYQVVFAKTAGGILKELPFDDVEFIAAKQLFEKTISINLDANSVIDAEIFNTPTDAITLQVTPISITFADETSLSLEK